MIGLLQVCYISEWVFPDEPHWQQLRAHEGWREARRDTRQRQNPVCTSHQEAIGNGKVYFWFVFIEIKSSINDVPYIWYHSVLCVSMVPDALLFQIWARFYIEPHLYIWAHDELLILLSSNWIPLFSPHSMHFLCLVQYWWPLITQFNSFVFWWEWGGRKPGGKRSV